MGDSVEKNFTLRKWTAVLLIVGGIGAAAYLFLPSSAAHARSALGKQWPASDRVSMDEIDHSSFDAVLKKYVDEDGYVDYSAWQASPADRDALHEYFAELSRADRGKPARREAILAFWINAYNAVTLEGILRVYPTSSIREHTSRLGGYNIWKHLPLKVGDEAWSLEQMEHEILRPLDEPRIHFAIVCASVGCPRLLDEAYTADELERQLEINTRDFLSRGGNFRIDAAGGTVYLSSILEWYADDFGSTRSEQLEYFAQYLPGDEASVLTDPETEIEYLEYDWSLNDQARGSSRTR